MSDETDMTTRESGPVENKPENVQTLRPPVNIFEDADGITLEADMPGVSKDRLQIQVDTAIRRDRVCHFPAIALPQALWIRNADHRLLPSLTHPRQSVPAPAVSSCPSTLPSWPIAHLRLTSALPQSNL